MSTSAGRVLLIPKGDYSSATQYSPMDVVLYEGDSYVCKQSSTGNAPTNTTYWQPLTDVASQISDISDDVSELNEALTDEAETRAALGAHNLRSQPFSVNREAGLAVVNNADGSITISGTHTAPSGTTIFRCFDNIVDAGTYIYSVGENIPSGCRLVVELKSGKELSGSTKTIAISDEEVESVQFTLTEEDLATYPYLNISINVYYIQAWGVSKTYYPMIRLATDSDPNYQPYAPTNYELGNNKANKSDLASISITGTTNSTGSTIASGTYFYLNGALVKAKTDIANGATLTKNTNYVEVTAGGLVELTQALGDYKTGGFTKASSDLNDHLSIKQFGKVITVNGYIESVTASANTQFTLGTISGVDAPPIPIRTTAGVASAGYNPPEQIGYLSLSTGNSLVITVTEAITSKALYFSFSYTI